MIDRGHELALGLSRSTLYHQPRPVPAAELAIMRRIHALHLDYPFAGSRMGIEAIYREPNTSKAASGQAFLRRSSESEVRFACRQSVATLPS
jgi:putative transposase